jgi:hypothetical protein
VRWVTHAEPAQHAIQKIAGQRAFQLQFALPYGLDTAITFQIFVMMLGRICWSLSTRSNVRLEIPLSRATRRWPKTLIAEAADQGMHWHFVARCHNRQSLPRA